MRFIFIFLLIMTHTHNYAVYKIKAPYAWAFPLKTEINYINMIAKYRSS